MEYRQFTITTTTDAEDIISAVLSDTGINGIEISDSVPWTKEELDEIFVDEVPVDTSIPEGVAYISFYLSCDEDINTILGNVRDALNDMKTWADIPCGPLSISEKTIHEEDYINSWKAFFHAFDIDFEDGKKMSIIPSWEEDSVSVSTDLVLHIDPGTAFGTGAHETTKLCIKALEKYTADGMSVLDLGTGSGILSMAAFKFGAAKITGTDVDVNAIPAVKDNFTKNDLSDADFRLLIGNVVSDEAFRREAGADYDIVVANILPIVLKPLTPVMSDMVKSGGLVIYSGILTEKAPEVSQVLKDNGFSIIEQTEMGEWCAIISKAP